MERADELLSRGVGIPQPENFMTGDAEDDFMGAIKVKDGLFIGDEFSAQVSQFLWAIDQNAYPVSKFCRILNS
jgi:hypothetical protein